MMDLLNYFFFVAGILYDWCNKGRGMCYPVLNGVYKIIDANLKE